MLEVCDLVKRYPSGDEVVRVLDGVSLTVARGQFVALYGPSGSGKTTLLTIVAALMRPDAGSITVAGRDLMLLSNRDAALYRRAELGYVTQAPNLLAGGSVLDNAALKLIGLRPSGSRRRLKRREAHGRVAPLLERLGLSGRVDHRPHELSMGERQRVLIARALSTEPKLLLADEPTGSLDANRSDRTLTLLKEVCFERRVALLLVTHDPRAAEFADTAYELRDGRIGDYRPEASRTY